jgi:hypothetical protein
VRSFQEGRNPDKIERWFAADSRINQIMKLLEEIKLPLVENMITGIDPSYETLCFGTSSSVTYAWEFILPGWEPLEDIINRIKEVAEVKPIQDW